MDVGGTQSGFDVEAGDRRGDVILILHQKKKARAVDRAGRGRTGVCVCVCACKHVFRCD